MDKLFIDVNIVLDVALARTPHFIAAQKLLSHIEKGKAQGYISALSCAIIYYFIEKELGHKKALEYIADLMELLHVVEVNHKVLEQSLKTGLIDFEDSIQAICAQNCAAKHIITRDKRGYRDFAVDSLTPAEYIASFL